MPCFYLFSLSTEPLHATVPVWPVKLTHCIAACRFFPSVHYLSTSKMAIAVIGNLAFSLALCMYHLITKVRG